MFRQSSKHSMLLEMEPKLPDSVVFETPLAP
jgi:hypothetical protein